VEAADDVRRPRAALIDVIGVDVDYAHARNLDRRAFESLLDGQWVDAGHSVVISGPAGVGKTFLARVLCNAARAAGHSVASRRISPLLDEIEAARLGDSYHSLMRQLSGAGLLVLDEWGLASFSQRELRDLIDILDDRRRRSVVLVSHIPIEAWYDFVGDPALASTFVDRMGGCEHVLSLCGTSRRPRRPITAGPRPPRGLRAKLLAP